MAIIQQPDTLSLSGNLKPFVISSGNPVSFSLKEEDTVILDTSYEPGPDGRVTIDVREVVENRLSFTLSHDNFYPQIGIAKTFTAVVDGQNVTFRALRAGVANLDDTSANWLKLNFLTWQPTQKPVTYYSPEWLTYYAVESGKLKLRAYFNDGAHQVVDIGNLVAGNAYTANLQYAVVAGILGNLYPSYYEVWAESSAGVRLSYIQRYLYDLPRSEQEQWFLFENSLGGIDTLRAYGDTDFIGNHEHKIAQSGDTLAEYAVDTKRFHNKNTGHLDEYERRWLLDFFPSKRKYVHASAAIRSIVVSESDVKYAASDLPSSYTFKYRFADTSPLLNLVRNQDSIPSDIVIPDISSPDFILPPRLSEYPRVALSEGVMLPAFDPFSDTPKVTTVGAILVAAIAETISKIQNGEGGGELVNLIRENDAQGATDNNVFSALRTLLEITNAISEQGGQLFLSKVNPDVAAGLIKFLAGIEFGEFIPGMFGGKGGKIDAKGNAELTSLRIRALLEVPELRYNRLTVIGDEFILTESGLIESVEQLADRSYRLNMKLEDGEAIAFHTEDLVKGIFNNAATSGTAATSYMRIEEVGQTFIKVTLALDTDVPSGYNLPPQDFMNIARVGNVTDTDRQKYMVFSSRLGGYQLYDGASDFLNGTPVASFDTAQSFKSKFNNLPLRDGLPYVYAAGLVVQDIIRVDYQGKKIREIHDRGLWQQGATYYNDDMHGTDDVWHNGLKWRCFSASTQEEPSRNSPAWVRIGGIDIRVGGKNLLREYDIRFNFKYWGGTGEFEEIDLDAFEPAPYLEVSPDTIMWVYPEYEDDINVQSNVDWTVN